MHYSKKKINSIFAFQVFSSLHYSILIDALLDVYWCFHIYLYRIIIVGAYSELFKLVIQFLPSVVLKSDILLVM